MDIHSLQMLGAYGFLGAVFSDFEKNKVSVDVLASSEVSVSVTLDKKQKDEDIEALCDDLSSFAEVELHKNRAILTLIADVGRSSDVLATVFRSFSAHRQYSYTGRAGYSKADRSDSCMERVLS